MQILETERLLSEVSTHPTMGLPFTQKLDELREEFESIPATTREPSVTLLFSGAPTIGSIGIDAQFLSMVILPFQKMVHSNLVQADIGRVGARGQLRGADEAKLFVTALPRGSFGVELSKVHDSNVFDDNQFSDALVRVSRLIDSSARSDEDFAASLGDISGRTIQGLRQFLKVVSDNEAGIVVESGGMRASLLPEDIHNAYTRVSDTITFETEISLQGVLKGILLESWRFDFVDSAGTTITGTISDELAEDELSTIIGNYFNRECRALFKKTVVALRGGNVRESYTLRSVSNG